MLDKDGPRKVPASFLMPTTKENRKKLKVNRNPRLKYEWTTSKISPINEKRDRYKIVIKIQNYFL
ncbi:MAG: hypothetical protein COV71_04860 [Candidatus Omnitrophica bacterium CG11_big_fil_rev_8_21_14_0_20_41_12]|nr:MAG: hypothetical protein COV71_04860 [Candidatus Omnitrophica bacterium CG11_big_fil_rev_8_21_14_0_20_41_12]